MANDIPADRNSGAKLPANESGFLERTFGDTPETPEVPKVEEAPSEGVATEQFNIIAARERPKAIDAQGLGFLSNVAGEIENGLTNNLANLVTDYSNALPSTAENDVIIENKALAMAEKYNWSTEMADELMAQSASPEEVQRRAERIFEQQAYMASLENSPMSQQLIAGFAGFVLDPVNLIPGGVILKGGQAATRVLPKISNALTKTPLGKTGTWAAMGAIEEATRNFPRTMADPTYSYEMYRMDIAMGAGFGGGLAALVPAGKFAFSKVSAGVRKATDKYSTHLETRMAVNTLTDALKVTKAPAARKALQEAIDQAIGKEAMETLEKVAKVERAQAQVDNSKTGIFIRDLHSEVGKKMDAGVFDADEIIKEFADELKKTSPTFAKIAEAIAKRIKRAADAADSPQSMGAAKRKTSAADVAEDLTHDAMKATEQAFDAAVGAAKAAKDIKAETALNVMRSIVKRGITEKQKIAGVKVKRVKLSDADTSAAIGSKFKRYQKTVNELDNEFNRILKLSGSTQRNVLSTALHQAMDDSGTSLKNFHKDIVDNPELGHKVQVNMDKRFDKLIDDLYTASDSDTPDIDLYNAAQTAYTKMRADVSWARMASETRSAEQIALEPEWAQMSKDFQDMMGGDLELLDEIYNSGFNKVLRNQFGGFTRSYAGELAASRSPLAQYAALHIFELPGGTGGKIARNETAAISMEMFESAAKHPVNVAWDKVTRIEAQAQGLGWLKSATMRHSSATADINANALGRKVQLEMNHRQMGTKSDQAPHIKAFADELETAYDLMYKTQHENGVQGITGKNKIKAYMSQNWDEQKVMNELVDDGIGQDGFEALVMQSLKNRNKDALEKDLRAQARTVVERMVNNVTKKDGTPKHNIVTDGDYINERKLHLDLNTSMEINGKTVHILDYMGNDVVSDLNKYAKKTAATSAISRATQGKLNSAEAISGFIRAVGEESQALGTGVDVGDMTNAFKLMMGEPIMGFDARVRKIRDGVSLSGMNGLGESQLAELGLAMNRGAAGLFATMQVLGTKAQFKPVGSEWTGMKIQPKGAASAQVLLDMQTISTLYPQMHNLARQNVHFDEVNSGASTTSTMKALNKGVDMVTGGKYRPVLQHAQTKYTGYGSIRTMQEQIAMAGLMHDVGRKIAKQPHATSDARLADIGFPMELIRRKIKAKEIEVDWEGNITDMGMDTWSAQEQHTLGVALRRHSAQQVQVGFAGEQSALMNNPWVAFMMQFRTYPNIAAEKQQMRNAMFHDREAAMGLVLNAATSMAARTIRYHSLALAKPEDKRDAYIARKNNMLLHDTALYMGGVGTMLNTIDIARDPSEAVPPVFNWANNYRKAVVGLGDGVSQRDMGNFANALPLGTIAQANLITGIIRSKTPDDSELQSKQLGRFE